MGEEVLRQIARVKSEAERRVASGSGDHASSDGVAPEPTPESIELAQGVRRAAELLSTGLVEREVEVKLMLLAALAGEHLLLLGPPGTAKSELARRLSSVCQGAYFERLLTRFSVPEELFGPLSMRGLENDRYERQTAGYLPEAEVAFIDEIFKANSAILNALLTLLNERLFDNGSERLDVPLLCMVGASNELPESEELDALFDRFLIRKTVNQVSSQGLRQLAKLAAGGATSKPFQAQQSEHANAPALPSLADFVQCHDAAVAAVSVPDAVLDMLAGLRDHLQDKCEPPIYVSDRRFTKCVQLLQVAAYANGASVVSAYDALILQFALGQRQEDGEKVAAYVQEHIQGEAAILNAELALLGLFGRACRVLEAGEEGGADAREELVREGKGVMADLRGQEASLASALEGGFPLMRGSLWFSPQQVASAAQVMAPPMKENLNKVRLLAEETLCVLLCLEEKAERQVLEKVLPKRLRQYEKGVGADA